MHKAGYAAKETEGHRSGAWVLIDFGDVIVHILIEKTVSSIIWNGSGMMERELMM